MGLVALPFPEPPVGAQIEKKKKGATKRWRARDTGKGGIFGGIANSGGGILDPNPTMAREDAWQGSTAFRNAAEQQTQQADPLSLLQQQLFDTINSINIAPTPLEELRKMATQQVAAQFDPQIDALTREMGAHSKRAGQSQKDAKSMYGALAQDYLSQLPAMTQQFAAEDQATNQRYDQAQQQMGAEYQKNAAAQNALLKQLGIQAAAPDASQQALDDQSYFQNQMEMDQQGAMSALNQQQMAQQNYQQNLGNNAKMAGANLSSDIGRELEEYMTDAGGQLTSLQGQRGGAIAALLSQLQQQDQQRVSQQQQQEFDNQMKLFNFQLDATNSQMRNANSGGGASSGQGFGADGTLTTGLPGAQSYLASQYPTQPIRATNLMEMLNNVLSDQEVTQGKFVLDPGNPSLGQAPKYSDVGQQYMEDLLRRQFEQQKPGEYSGRDINATIAALQAYLGKLR